MRIAITGMGIISAIGDNVGESVAALRDERGGIMRVSYPIIGGQMVGRVNIDNYSLSEELEISGEIPRSVLLGVKAAREALAMSGCESEDMLLVNGTTVGGMDLTEEHYPQLREGNERYREMHLAGRCSQLIAEYTGLRMKAVTISTACSSALNSIITAGNMILSGREKRVLAGGTECLTLFHQMGFNSLGIVDRVQCRPFDADRGGLNLGEGAAYLVLESEKDAMERGAEIIGYVAGYGNACDAYHQTATSPEGEGAYMAMEKALDMAGMSSDGIEYVNAHGTATLDNDSSESRAIERLFGVKRPMVSSTKGFTGHTTSASGAIETVISLIAMREGFLPANLHWKRCGDGMIVPIRHTVRKKLERAMCNSFGFGGNDSSLILTAHPCGGLKEIGKVDKQEICCVEKREGDDYDRWLKPLEARRMTGQMRLVTAAACEALEKAGIEKPDAIITTTALGMIINSMKLETAISEEEEVKPTLFMLSTHNSISSMLAIRFGCHGYNSTFCPEDGDAHDAIEEGERLIDSGEARYVMVVEYEENEEIWNYPAKAIVKIIGKI